MNLREFVDLLEENGRLKRIKKEVDPVYEVAALMDEAGDTPLYLENVKGSILPCITNICSSRELVLGSIFPPSSYPQIHYLQKRNRLLHV